MEITIRLLASYRQYVPGGPRGDPSYRLRVDAGARVADVLADLPIPPNDAYTFFVNGRHAERGQALQAGDVLSVFPAVGGG
jgi:sulfur carrier protein ThiS